MAGFILACCMPVLAVLVAAGMAARLRSVPNSDPTLYSLIVPFTDAFVFAVLIGFAYALRKNGPAHKRLVILATTGITGAAFFRWHVAILFHEAQAAYIAGCIFLLFLIALISGPRTGCIARRYGRHISTPHGTIAPSAPWHAFMHHVQTWSI